MLRPFVRTLVIATLLSACSHDWEQLRPRDTGTLCPPSPPCVDGVPLCISDYTNDACCPDLDGPGANTYLRCFTGNFLAAAAHADTFAIPNDDARWRAAPSFSLQRAAEGSFDALDTAPYVQLLWNEASGLYIRGHQERDDVRLNPAGLQPEPLWWHGDAFEFFVRMLYANPTDDPLMDADSDGHFIAVPQRAPVYSLEQHGGLVATGGSRGGGFPVETRIAWPGSASPAPRQIIAFDAAFDDADTTDAMGTVREAQVTFGADANAYASTRTWSAVVLLGEGEVLQCPAHFIACSRNLCIPDRPGTACP